MRNKPSQLATQNCCATSCTKIVARFTDPLKFMNYLPIVHKQGGEIGEGGTPI